MGRSAPGGVPQDDESRPSPLVLSPVAHLESGSFRHESRIVAAALSCKDRLVCVDAEGCVTGWELPSRKRLYRRQVTEASPERRRLACSPDGRWVAVPSAGEDSPSIQVLDLATGDEVCRIDRCRGAAFSWDGTIVAGWKGKVIRRWDLGSGKELPRLAASDAEVVLGAFSPDGQTFAATVEGMPGPVLWESASGRKRFQIPDDSNQPGATGLAWASDGKTLAVGDAHRVHLWNPEALSPLSVPMDAYGGPPLRFSRDGTRLVGALRRNIAGAWDLKTGECLATWHVPLEPESFLEIADDGSRLIQVRGTGVRVAVIPNALGEAALPGITCVGFRPDGRVVTCSTDGRVHAWDPITGREIETAITRATFLGLLSRDGKFGIQKAADASLQVWDLAGDKELLRIDGIRFVTCWAFSPDASELVLGTHGRDISFWDVAARRERLRVLAEGVGVSAIGWSGDGRKVAWGEASGSVAFADAKSGKEYVRFRPRGLAILRIAVSPDGNRAVTAHDRGAILLWTSELGREPVLLGRSPGPVGALAFTPDGRRVASTFGESALRLWRVDGGTDPIDFQGHRTPATSIAFSPDGKLIAAGGGSPSALVWTVPPEK